MSSRTRSTFVGTTRVDVTDCAATRIPDRITANAVADAEVYLERRGGRTYLVTETPRIDAH
ncbi:hypothetical protein SAMN05192561_11311 [Halopenitus malekzadehii]|uniref:Uncharacterized protein n=1 Tax=Halopenitus malekzadehii TaxID=1267564 RepID=A0A1H6JGW4_9EURY|nr:hypothetical protein [Halopenitus malekzadehii]SEH61492.1 hypothetical protein SAMN05192561_11311 [Halopenitus malekzadehii]